MRDDDLNDYEAETRKVVVRVRDIFDECASANPCWLPELLIQEMHSRKLINDDQNERWREDLGL
jgi:hypothetical protein